MERPHGGDCIWIIPSLELYNYKKHETAKEMMTTSVFYSQRYFWQHHTVIFTHHPMPAFSPRLLPSYFYCLK